MNLTGDGNGLDMVMMPQDFRARVPTANFFQQSGYERNPVARRTAVVAGLFADIESKMTRASQSPGAKDLAAAFLAHEPESQKIEPPISGGSVDVVAVRSAPSRGYPG